MNQPNTRYSIRALCEGAIMVALATILSLIRLFRLPNAGSINLSMLPIFIYCCRWGWKESFLMTLAYAILQLFVDGAYGWGPVSIIFDYLLAFPVLSVAALFHKFKNGIYPGIALAGFLRFVCHFISGATAFRITAPTALFNSTFTNPYLYSAIYNVSFIALDCVLCICILALLRVPLKRQLVPQNTSSGQ